MPILKKTKYRRPKFPSGAEWIVLVDDEDFDIGPLRVSAFGRNNDDNEYAAQTPGRAVFLRIVKQKGNEIWSEAGDGKIWHYRMFPVSVT